MKAIFKKLLFVGTLFFFIACAENHPVSPFQNGDKSITLEPINKRGSLSTLNVMMKQ